MTTPADDTNEFDRLLAAAVEGDLAPEDQERLAELLRKTPSLREQYLDYLLIDSLLQWEQPAPVRRNLG